MTTIVVVLLAAVTAISAVVALQQRRIAIAAQAASASTAVPATEQDGLAGAAALLRGALDVLDSGVTIVDRDGAIVHRNAASEALADARGADVLVAQALDDALGEARDGVAIERTLELFGPPPRTIILRAVPLGSTQDEGAMGAVGLVEDVTERQRLEAVRRDFVANISHELRTPIGALGVLADAMADADDPATARRLADRLGDEVARVTRTIEDLLELSRIEGGGDALAADVAVAAVVEEAVERARPVADGAGIAVAAVPTAEPLVVRGDRRQLVSALFNLLDNAIKYSDPTGTVEISARRDGDEIAIAVVDQGIGIPAADIDRVFERFYRVDAARRRATGGTGLGLAIVRHVAVNHGGTITVHSRAGEGSTFTLRLPAAPVAADAAEAS